MPVIIICTNVVQNKEDKSKFVAKLTEMTSEVLRCPTAHVHTVIRDQDFFAFGGDAETPACYVTFKSASLQIREEMRKVLVDKLVPLLEETYKSSPDRVTTFFDDVPVENIAVGNQIMVFAARSAPVSPTAAQRHPMA